MESVGEVLRSIAVKVYRGGQGAFLSSFADAYLLADSENEKILRPAWMQLIDKYLLDMKVRPVPMHPLESEREVSG